MNPITIIIFCFILIFLFIIYILFRVQGIDIFSEVFDFVYGKTVAIFGEPFYMIVSFSMLAIVAVALIMFRFSASK